MVDLAQLATALLTNGLMHAEDFDKHVPHPPARSYAAESKAVAATAVDVKENSSSYIFEADMPGLSKSDIKVEVENDNVLSITGKRKRDEKADEDTKFIRMERRAAKFMRRFTLPGDANVEQISASCQDGVLTVTVPKIPPEPQKPRTVEIPIS
ncbi:17.3 kDa class II heat shock protein-like [Selaginella moellendorffii]|uniref:17.3 kDa class II heat shock protein-like n=1 Tax=Selaginella moellendorffii TaxID=88036 RepID=UPI000D1C895D|nr:17.3 kDa class II heat shock protein-like [Selaginella moellendorffii]|eukprot:XP_024545049.1 17.3 kDa class II heat shock protein-like [Selaginella moellendorffii]